MEISTLFFLLLFGVQGLWPVNAGPLFIPPDFVSVVKGLGYQYKGYAKCCTLYYANSTATFQIQILCTPYLPPSISLCPLLSGDIETNPGPDGAIDGANSTNRSPSRNNVAVTLFNARSLRRKLSELELFLSISGPDILCITETWLGDDIDDAALGIPDDYMVSRHDRNGRRGGGVLFAIHQSLSPERLNIQSEDSGIELLWASITFRGNKWLFGLLYRPPSSPASFWDLLQSAVDAANVDSFDGCILLGDFNVDMSVGSASSHRNRLQEIMDESGLVQLVTSHTRVVSHGNTVSGSIIDLVFTNRKHSLIDIKTDCNPVDSDHLAINFRLRSPRPSPLPSTLRSFLQIHKGDFIHLRNVLRLIPWRFIMSDSDVDECNDTFLDLFHAAVNDSIPKKNKRKNRCSPWITPELRQLFMKKRSLFRVAKRTRDPSDWDSYKSVRNDVKTQCRKAYWSYVNSMFTSDDNRRKFWSFIRSRKNSPPPPKFRYNDATIVNSNDIASVFGSYFSSVFNPSVPVPTDPPVCPLPIDALSHLSLCASDVYKALLKLQKNKSPGPDGVLPGILSRVALEISHPISILFNTSLRCGKVPTAWKCANITPVHKGGDRSCISNYRPVALTSILSKLLERFVATALHNHIDSYGLLCTNQHGFTAGRSCVTQLVNVLHSWSTSLDKRRPTRIDAVFLDMSKAFDKMPHHVLLSKLAVDFNVQGQLWHWICSFLSGRIQRVIFMGSTSEWTDVQSGVPQGSVLGPKLFNLFVNDLPLSVLSQCVLFADDVLLFREITSRIDEVQLQDDLNALHLWAHRNNMIFNAAKTKIMHVTKKNCAIDSLKSKRRDCYGAAAQRNSASSRSCNFPLQCTL